MSLQKWSQVEQLFSPTSTTKICVIDEADPVNKIISVADLIGGYFSESGGVFTLTKAMVEAVLTGNITSHTHSQYLTAITKAMVEAVLTGVITSHGHNVADIVGAASLTDLENHALDSSHLTSAQLIFLTDLMTGDYFLTQDQKDVLNLLSIVDGDLHLSTNLVVDGNITANNISPGDVLNYEMLTAWEDYLPAMTDWVISVPLAYGLYTDIQDIWTALDTKVDKTIQVLPGIGISGGGTLDADVTINLDISGLGIDTIISTDYIPFYNGTNQYRSLVSELPFVSKSLGIYTPVYSNINSLNGGGLSGGGLLTSDLYLELDIINLEVLAGLPDPAQDWLIIYDASTLKSKKVLVSNLPYSSAITWGAITGDIEDQYDLWTILQGKASSAVSIIAGEGLYGGGALTTDRTIELNLGGLIEDPILTTDYIPFYRSGGWQYRAEVSTLATLLGGYTGWSFQSQNSGGTQIGIQTIASGATAAIKAGTNVTLTQSGGVITISASTTGATYTGGTGIDVAGTVINHLNVVTPAVQALYPIAIDAEGHIDTYGSAVTTLPNANNIILKFDTGSVEGTSLYTYNGASAKTIDIQGSTGITLTKTSGVIAISHTDTSSITDLTTVTNTFVSAITFDTFGHTLTKTASAVNFNVSGNYAFSNVGISTDSGFSWGTANTNTTQAADSSSDTITFVNGTKINLYAVNPETTGDGIKIEHQSTTRTDTTSSDTNSVFTVIDSITSDTTGHITAINVKTVTVSASSGLSGSGTIGYLPKWTNTTILGDSPVYTDGTTVGIGVASSMVGKLDIMGSAGSILRIRDNFGTYAGGLILGSGVFGSPNGGVIWPSGIGLIPDSTNYAFATWSLGLTELNIPSSGYSINFSVGGVRKQGLFASGGAYLGYGYSSNDPGVGKMIIENALGVGVTTPTARIHLAAHSTSAGSAPIKLTSGTAMTTAENGALEYHSSHLYFTIGTTRYQLDQQSGGSSATVTDDTTTNSNFYPLFTNVSSGVYTSKVSSTKLTYNPSTGRLNAVVLSSESLYLGTATPKLYLGTGSDAGTSGYSLISGGVGALTWAQRVSSVGGTGTVSGLTLTGTVTTTGNLTLGGTLSVTPSNFASQSANTVLAAPSGSAGVPTFRLLASADIPNNAANTTGSAGSVINSVTFTNTGGASPGITYNGSAARIVDYSTVGAAAAGHTHSYTTTNITEGTNLYFTTARAGDAITANNGLTKNTSNNVQLGGTLVANTTITATSYQLLVTGTDYPLKGEVTGTSSASTGVIGVSVNGSGVNGQSTGTGTAGVFTANTGAGISVSSNVIAGIFQTTVATTNTIVAALQLVGSSTLSTANGFGVSTNFYAKDSIGTNNIVGQIVAKWIDVTNTSRKGQLELITYTGNAGISTPLTGLTVKYTGQIQFNTYTGTTFDATPIKYLGVDASGNIVTSTISSGGLGTVTSVAAGDGMTFTTFTTSGSVVMGTPSNITSSTTNSVSTGTHTHALDTISTITPGAYTNVNITVDSKGRITLIANGATTGVNTAVQTFSGTNITWNANDGINGTLTLTGNTNITFTNLVIGTTGNLSITNTTTAYTISFALSGKTIKVSPSVYSGTLATVLSTGINNTKFDVFSWYYDGINVYINGTNDYKY